VRLIVAGGAGFIGSHMCDALISRGDEVVAVDNLVTGQRCNIAQLEAGRQVAVLLEGVHYDGGNFLKAIPRQNDYLGEFGYYMAPLKMQPFVKFEDQKFGVSSNPSKDVKRFGAGLNYYVSGQNLKLTGQYLRVTPDNHAIRSSNELSVQFQIWYY